MVIRCIVLLTLTSVVQGGRDLLHPQSTRILLPPSGMLEPRGDGKCTRGGRKGGRTFGSDCTKEH